MTDDGQETGSTWSVARLALALGSDQGELRALIDELTPVIHARVVRLLFQRGTPHVDRRTEVEDLTQAVFLTLFERDARVLRRWSPERGLSLQNFVGLVAQRYTISRLRTARHNPWAEEPAGDDLGDRAAEGREGLESRVASKERLGLALERLESEMNPRAMHLFSRLWVEERGVVEVCAELRMRPAAVYAWRSRLARRLRAILSELQSDFGRPERRPRKAKA